MSSFALKATPLLISTTKTTTTATTATDIKPRKNFTRIQNSSSVPLPLSRQAKKQKNQSFVSKEVKKNVRDIIHSKIKRSKYQIEASKRTTSYDDDDKENEIDQEMVVLEKMYNFSAVGILFSTTVDVAMNFLAAMLAFMTKHDFTYFVTNRTGFWTEKIVMYAFVLLLLLDFKQVGMRQVSRAKNVLNALRIGKETTTIESIEQTSKCEKVLLNVRLKIFMEILGALVAFFGCLQTLSPSIVSIIVPSAFFGPAIALFFGHALFMLLNENSVSNSANIVTTFPIKVRKTIATFDIALASLCVLARVFSKGYSGLVLSTLFLLFSVYFTFENEIKKMSKKNKNKKNDGTNDSKNDNSSSSTSNNAAPA